jgi:hypothetical protein
LCERRGDTHIMAKELEKVKPSSLSLPELASQINAEHLACLDAACNAVVRATEVGRLLTEAKELVGHGEWIPWVEANCVFGDRQARKYMRVYSMREQIGTRSSDFNLNSVLAALSDSDDDQPGPPDLPLEEEETQAKEEPPPKPPRWTASEKQRKKVVESGYSVVANMKTDVRLVQWAKENGLFVRVDRKTIWGNPFVLNDDGDRETVLESFGVYLTMKPSLEERRDDLRGKVLGCWCYPDGCHGDILIRNAHGECAPDEAERVGCHS